MVVEREDVTRLIGEIDNHLVELQGVLDETKVHPFPEETAETFSLRAFGSLLHDFYSGVEAILQLIATDVDGFLPTSSGWHRRLLRQMTAELQEIRPPVVSRELAERLDEYRGFRHVFRNV